MGISSYRFLFLGDVILPLFLTPKKKLIMNELIEKLMQEAQLDQEQARKAIETIAGFVKEKFPMLGGAVDQIFSTGKKDDQGL